MSLFWHAFPDWLASVSLACCVGVVVCSRWVLPPVPDDAPGAEEHLLAGMRWLLGASAAALLLSSVLGLLVRAAEMSGGPITRVVDVLPTVLLQTHVGHAWLVRTAAVVALSLAIMRGRGASRFPRQQFVVLGCAVIAAATDSASGHASDAGDFSSAEFVDWLHLLAALVWGGGLLVLSVGVLPRLGELRDCAARWLPGVAVRFSALAAPAAGLIALTAGYQAWTYGGRLAELTTSPFGRTIIAKTVLFAVLLALGAFNRFVSVPRLQQWAACASTGSGGSACAFAPAPLPVPEDARGRCAAAWFARAVKLEALLVVAILLCAALLRHEAPVRQPVHLEHHGAVHASWSSGVMAFVDTARPAL